MDRCVGQSYDGASNMSGATNGCAARIKQKHPNAIYFHCKAHILNLSLVKSCTSIPAVSKLILHIVSSVDNHVNCITQTLLIIVDISFIFNRKDLNDSKL